MTIFCPCPPLRKAAQDEACKEQAARLEALKHTASMVASRQEALINEQLESIRRRQVQLCEQLLHLLRHVSGLPRGGACRRGAEQYTTLIALP